MYEIQITLLWRHFDKPEKTRPTYRGYSYAISSSIKEIVEFPTMEQFV